MNKIHITLNVHCVAIALPILADKAVPNYNFMNC